MRFGRGTGRLLGMRDKDVKVPRPGPGRRLRPRKVNVIVDDNVNLNESLGEA
jgi:hypothetical protein